MVSDVNLRGETGSLYTYRRRCLEWRWREKWLWVVKFVSNGQSERCPALTISGLAPLVSGGVEFGHTTVNNTWARRLQIDPVRRISMEDDGPRLIAYLNSNIEENMTHAQCARLFSVGAGRGLNGGAGLHVTFWPWASSLVVSFYFAYEH